MPIDSIEEWWQSVVAGELAWLIALRFIAQIIYIGRLGSAAHDSLNRYVFIYRQLLLAAGYAIFSARKDRAEKKSL